MDLKSLAILPFQSHKGTTTNEDVLNDGLADALAMRLYAVKNLKIIPGNAVRRRLAESADSFKIGKLLGADYILEGFIFTSKIRTRFTVQLLNVNERSVVWAAQFDEKETDIFTLEDRVSKRIAAAILPHLQPAEIGPITDSALTPDTSEVEKEEIRAPEKPPIVVPESAESQSNRQRFHPALYVLLAAVVVLGGIYLWQLRSDQPSNQDQSATENSAESLSLIVLPFQNAEEQSSDDALGVGLAESLTASLGNMSKLFVLSANAGRDAARRKISVSQIGKQFGANYLVRGKINRAENGKAVQVTAEMLDAKSDENIVWSKNFETTDDEISLIPSKISDEISGALKIPVHPAERKSYAEKAAASGLAYELYLAGRYQMASRTHAGLHRAIASFNEAINRDKNFALPYAGLADAYSLENLYETPPPADAYAKAEEYARQALILNPNSSEAHTSMGQILFYQDRERGAAENEFRRAIDLNRSNAAAHHWLSGILSAMGRHDEAIAEIELAQRLDPFSAVISSAKGLAYFYARRYEQAISECDKSLELNEGFVPALRVKRWIYQAQNDYKNTYAVYLQEKSFDGDGDAPGWLLIDAQIEALRNKKVAKETLEKSLRIDEIKNTHSAYATEIALAYMYLDEKDKAFEWLEKAEAAKAHVFNYIEVDPRFDRLHDDPRFAELVNKLKNPK